MTMKQAVCFNFLSACTCYVGFVIGEIIGEATDGTQWVLVMTAGMFLYISLVDMVSLVPYSNIALNTTLVTVTSFIAIHARNGTVRTPHSFAY